MGFDFETKDRHQIYWLEKRSITVERSVKFNFKDEIEIPILPLGKEDIQQSKTPSIENSDEDVEKKDIIEDIPPTEGRGKRIQKESGYIRRLKEGEGVGKTGERMMSILPRGIQEGTSILEPEPEDFVMATAIATSEGLEPTYEEACKHPDWPKWDLAIQKELEGLKKTGTWQLVE